MKIIEKLKAVQTIWKFVPTGDEVIDGINTSKKNKIKRNLVVIAIFAVLTITGTIEADLLKEVFFVLFG
ncbi:hypothetical protein OAD61_00680 [bacterium]|nr:hypothetical protein [bacterium]